MAITLGGVTIPGALRDTQLNVSRNNVWGVSQPLGYIGRINTKMAVSPIDIPYHAFMTTAVKDSVKTLADAGVAVAFVYANGDISISMSVLIKNFIAQKNRTIGRSGYWDVNMMLEEQP